MSLEAYDKYISTSIAETDCIPIGWNILKLKYLKSDKKFSIVDGPFGSQIHADEYVNEGVPFIRGVNIDYNGNFFKDNLMYISEKKYKELKRSAVVENDLIIGKTGSVGKIGVFHGFEKGIISPNCLKLTLKKELCVDFIKYYLISDVGQKQISGNSSNSSRETINIGQFSNICLIIPPYNTQKAIAAFLEDKTSWIENIIEKNQKLIELLEEKRTSLINHAVTKGIDPDVPMNDSGIDWIGEIPEHWEVVKLKFLISQKAQYGANEEPEYDETKFDYRYVRITDVDDDGRLKEDSFVFLSKEKAHPYILNDGDILFARSGATVGKSFIYSENYGDCCFAGYMIRYIPNKNKLLPRFLLYFTLSKSYAEWIKYVSTQSTIQNVSADKYDEMLVPCPPMYVQKNIIGYLDTNFENIKNIKSKLEKENELLEEYKQSLIYNVVTGKVKVERV